MSGVQRSEPWLLDLVVGVRRHLHRHPELSHAEHRTAAFVEAHLQQLDGFEVFRPAPTSVAALAGDPASADPVVLRADLDALPMQETTGAPYASRNAGVTHACGHDGHTAALLGVATTLARRGLPDHPLLLVFQQAEESHPSGAPQVLAGLRRHGGRRLDRACFYGFHLWPDLPEHHVGVTAGPLMASVTGLAVRLTGAPGIAHGVRAQQGACDALEGAVALYGRLAPLRHGRTLSADDPSTVHLGCLKAGTEPQAVAQQAVLEGSLRAIDRPTAHETVSRIEHLVEDVSREFGLVGKADFEHDIRPPLVNDTATVEQIRRVCDQGAIHHVDYPPQPLGVSEDFGWYLDAGRGAYFLMGCGRAHQPVQLHDSGFDFDEHVLCTAVRILTRLAEGPRPS